MDINYIVKEFEDVARRAIVTQMPAEKIINLEEENNTFQVIETTARRVSQSLPQGKEYEAVANYEMVRNTLISNLRHRYCQKWPKEYYKLYCEAKCFKNKNYYPNYLDKLSEIFGVDNCDSNDLVEPYRNMEIVWEGFLEDRAYRQLIASKETTIQNLVESLKPHCSIRLLHQAQLEWSINGHEGIGFVDFIATIFTINRHDAMATLEYLVGMKLSNVLHFSGDNHCCEFSFKDCDIDIPRVLYLKRGTQPSEYIELDNIIKIYGASNQIIGAFIRYKWQNCKFYLPASVGSGVLCIGRFSPSTHLLNQHILDRLPYAKVIFFQDIHTAIAVNEKLKEILGYNIEEFVITGALCNQINILPFSFISGHDVFFVPAPSKTCIERIEQYFKFLCGTGANSCKFVPQFFLHTSPPCDGWRNVQLEYEEASRLIREAVVVSECINIIDTIRNAIKNALDITGFQKWGEALRILKSPKSALDKPEEEENSKLPKPTELQMPSRPQTLSEVNIFHTFRPGTYIYLVGRKGSGKTQLCFSLCYQLLYRTSCWPFFPAENIFGENICVVDGETPQDEFDENLRQYGLKEFLGKRLFCLTVLGEDQPDFMRDFSLGKDVCRKSLKQYLIQKKCRLLILDCLLLLTDHSPNSCVRDVLNFIKYLQQCGICVVLINHKHQENNDKARANEDYLNEARVVINIVDRDEIIASASSPAIAKEYASKDGLTLGLKYTHQKAAPILQNKTIYLHLPLFSKKWRFLDATGTEFIPSLWQDYDKTGEYSVINGDGKLALARNEDACESIENNKDLSKKLARLSPDARKVYDAIKVNCGSSKRDDLEKACDKSKDTILKLLGELIAEHLVESSGNGRGTFYKLVI